MVKGVAMNTEASPSWSGATVTFPASSGKVHPGTVPEIKAVNPNQCINYFVIFFFL